MNSQPQQQQEIKVFYEGRTVHLHLFENGRLSKVLNDDQARQYRNLKVPIVGLLPTAPLRPFPDQEASS